MWLRSALLIIFALVVSVSFSLPGEGLANADYGDSDSLPCDTMPFTSMAIAAGPSLRPSSSFGPWRSAREKNFTVDFNCPKDSIRPLFDSFPAIDHPLRF